MGFFSYLTGFGGRDMRLVLLPHDQPPALILAEMKLRDGGGQGRLFVRRLDGANLPGALSQDRDAPRFAQDFLRLSLRAWHGQ